jgi:hypothetical protein
VNIFENDMPFAIATAFLQCIYIVYLCDVILWEIYKRVQNRSESVALLMVPVGNKMMTDIVEKASEAVKFKLNLKLFFMHSLSRSKQKQKIHGDFPLFMLHRFSRLCAEFFHLFLPSQ